MGSTSYPSPVNSHQNATVGTQRCCTDRAPVSYGHLFDSVDFVLIGAA